MPISRIICESQWEENEGGGRAMEEEEERERQRMMKKMGERRCNRMK